MTIRDARPEDLPAIWRFHAERGADCPLPEASGRTLLAAQVLEDGGRIIGAVMAARAAEMILTLDHGWRTPRFRWEAVKALHRTMEQRLQGERVDCAYLWLAPPYEKPFGRKLIETFGWNEPLWRCLQKKVSP